jgi:hypothetical protein
MQAVEVIGQKYCHPHFGRGNADLPSGLAAGRSGCGIAQKQWPGSKSCRDAHWTGLWQMNLYLNYAREHLTNRDDNAPIGLILCSERDTAVAHYALGNLDNQVLAREYQLTAAG